MKTRNFQCMHTPRKLLFGFLLLCGGFISCQSTPQTSDTKTNFFQACSSSEDCEERAECFCGICTTLCGADAECEPGVCGSPIATAAACGNDDSVARDARICLPQLAEGESCQTAQVSLGPSLGESMPAACAAAGALICEDFEDRLSTDYAIWQESSALLDLQECQVNEGAGALRFTSINDGWTQLRMRLPDPVSEGAVHARFYLRIEDGGTLPGQLMLFEFWSQESGENEDRMTLFLNNDQKLAVSVGPASQSFSATEMPPIARDEWHCIELHFELSATSGSVSLRLDAEEVIVQTDLNTLPDTPLSVAVLASLPLLDTDGTEVAIAIDDLVIATAPIGCD